MEELNFISEYDRRILKRIIEREKKTPTLPLRQATPYPLQLPQSADIYIAYTPPSGIPALELGDDTGTGTGSGFGIQDDIPGSAYCDIYRLLGIGSAARFLPIRTSQLVYNLSTTAVPGSKWRQINRDRFGHWLVVGDSANAGGCGSLSFPVYRYRCEADGTGTASYVLNEYRLYMSISFDRDGCITLSQSDEVLVAAIACCDASCAGNLIIDTGAGATTLVNCCANALLQTLTLTVSSSTCPALSTSIPIVYNSGTGKWEAIADIGTCLNQSFTLECLGPDVSSFEFRWNASALIAYTGDGSHTCNPLFLVYTIITAPGGECGCPGFATFKFTITE